MIPVFWNLFLFRFEASLYTTCVAVICKIHSFRNISFAASADMSGTFRVHSQCPYIVHSLFCIHSPCEPRFSEHERQKNSSYFSGDKTSNLKLFRQVFVRLPVSLPSAMCRIYFFKLRLILSFLPGILFLIFPFSLSFLPSSAFHMQWLPFRE
jgi:hypothetical protein